MGTDAKPGAGEEREISGPQLLRQINLGNHIAKCSICFLLHDGTPVLCADGLLAVKESR